MDIKILPSSLSDADEIHRLETVCFSAPWSRDEVCSSLNQPGAVYFTAFISGKVAGYAGMYTVLDEGDINNVAVFPEYRRAGVGSALISALTGYAEKNGIKFLTLEVRDSNIAAKSLYEKAGFCRVGVRRGYYVSPKEDAILYKLDIINDK